MKDFIRSTLIPLLVSVACYIFLGPVLLLAFLANELVRLCISIYLNVKYEGNLQLVSNGADAMWTLKIPERTRVAVVGFKVNEPIPPERIRKCMKDTVLQVRDENGTRVYSKLERILVTRLGYACWKRDENFDIKNHVRSLSPNKIYTKSEVQKELREMTQDMSEERPQWELVTIPKFIDENEQQTSLVFLRFQHAYLDGFSLVMMVKNYISSGFEYYFNPKKFKIPFWKKLLFYTNAVAFGPFTFIQIVFNKFKSFWPELPCKDRDKTTITHTWTKTMDLDAIRKIRMSLQSATIPTIVENAFISAVKDILLNDRLPHQFSIGELAALLPYPTEFLQNRFAMFSYDVNPLQNDFDRIRTSKMDSWKAVTGPWVPLSFCVFKISGKLPVFMHYVALGGGSNSLLLSNMPVSKTKFSFLGAHVLEVLGFPPQPNATGITLISTASEKTLKISATAKSTWLREEELEQIVKRIPKILEEWEHALANYNL